MRRLGARRGLAGRRGDLILLLLRGRVVRTLLRDLCLLGELVLLLVPLLLLRLRCRRLPRSVLPPAVRPTLPAAAGPCCCSLLGSLC